MARILGRRGRWFVVLVVGLLATAGLTIVFTRPPASPPRAVFIGDSYTQGVGASRPDQRWTSVVARAEGWQEDNRGLGGTGYRATAGPSGCGRPTCENYATVAEQVAAGPTPSIVVIAGGQNDFVAYNSDPAGVSAAIEQTYRTVHELMPEAKVIAVGPSTAGKVDATVRAVDATVHRSADKVGARYVSLLEPSPAIVPSMVLADHAHVGDVGHQAIAQRVISDLG